MTMGNANFSNALPIVVLSRLNNKRKNKFVCQPKKKLNKKPYS